MRCSGKQLFSAINHANNNKDQYSVNQTERMVTSRYNSDVWDYFNMLDLPNNEPEAHHFISTH